VRPGAGTGVDGDLDTTPGEPLNDLRNERNAPLAASGFLGYGDVHGAPTGRSGRGMLPDSAQKRAEAGSLKNVPIRDASSGTPDGKRVRR
jgi:hypothetical protein